MRRLFLASRFCNVAERLCPLLPDYPDRMTVGYVPTATKCYREQRPDKDVAALIAMGFRIRELDLRHKGRVELERDAAEIDLWFVGGGDVFYLMEHVKRSGFDGVLRRAEKLFYVGSSAGSMIVGPSLLPARGIEGDLNVSGCPDLDRGIGIVEFLVLPHYDKENYRTAISRVVEEHRLTHSLVPLTDRQAVIVDGNTFVLCEVE